ncbi:MAG: type II toxin-antitoxin system HicB family antitoxin [Sphingomicrobium sp.]
MKNTLTYMGYQARVEFDADDGIFVGRIAGIDDNVGFHADNVDGLVQAFHDAVEDYRETCEKIGKASAKSYSGNVFLRVDEHVHARAALAAELSGRSLNEFGQDALREYSERLLRIP